jgi:nitrate reductase cytochrome c-type subunit
MKKLLLTTTLLGLTFVNAATPKEIKEEAKTAIVKLKTTLQTQLKSNLKKGGPQQAATFCSNKALNITHTVNTSFANDTKIRRISLKYRNTLNSPKSDEAIVLQQMQKDFDNGKKLEPFIVKHVFKDTYKVYKPIFINKGVCLKCHGDVQHRDEKAYKVISTDYPNDKAINYKMNDLRGAFVVTIVKK